MLARGLGQGIAKYCWDIQVCVGYLPGEETAAEDRPQMKCSDLLGNLGHWHSCGCEFDMHHLAKDCCRPRTSLVQAKEFKD